MLREVTVPLRDPKAHLAICKEIQELILTKAIVQKDDIPLLYISPIFVIPKKTGDLRVILNLKKINVFNVILPNLRSRLGSLDRFEGRLPSRTGSPSVQETAGFQIPRQDLCVQGLAFRPKRLSVGLFEGSSYGNSSPSPAGHPDILLSGRLAARRRVPVAPPVPPSCHSSVGPEFGVHRQSEQEPRGA